MTSTFSHHFDAVHLSNFHLNNNKHKRRSSSFQASVISNNHNNDNNNIKLKPIIEYKPYRKSGKDSRSQSFQISGYKYSYNHCKIRSRANRKLLNTVSPNINKILFDGTSFDDNQAKPIRKNITMGIFSKRCIKNTFLSSTQQFDNNNNKDLSIKIKGNRYNIYGNNKNNKNNNNNNDSLSIINNCIEGKYTLPFVVEKMHRNIIVKVLCHPKIRVNAGWFHRFLNSQDNNLNTALHIIAINGDLQICQMLLTFNVLKNVLNNLHKTALDLALEANNYDIAQLLLKNSAIPGPAYFNLNPNESKLSLKLCSLLNKYLDNSNIYNMAEAMRLYEKPLKFRNKLFSESSVDLKSVFGSEVGSTPTSSRTYGQNNSDRFDYTQPTNWFNSFVDF